MHPDGPGGRNDHLPLPVDATSQTRFVADRQERIIERPREVIRADEKGLLHVLLSDADGRESLVGELENVEILERIATRAIYQAELELLVDALAAGFRGANAKARALSLLSVLSGAAAMARAVKDDRIRQEILSAANSAAKAI